MADEIRHGRAISPWIVPLKGGNEDDFHGLTDVGADPSVGSDDVYVIGKKVKCGTDKQTPEVTVPLSMLERGELNSYLTLANLASEPVGGLTLIDFNSSLCDVIYYIKDEFNGVVDSTIWMPKCAINSLTVNVDDPEARLSRDMELGSDDRRILTGNNKYLIHKKDIAPSGVSGNYVIDISDPLPVVDPNNPGVYVLRIDRVRAGELVSLALTADYTYNNGTQDITILSALTGDLYHVFYSASSFGTAGDPTSIDSDSICFLKAENVTVLISDGTTEIELDRLTSLTLSATLNRIDESVIGNDERILREISDTPVTVDLSGRIKNYNEEKAFMNQLADASMISSVKLFNDNVRITVKVYNNANKDTFLIGYQVDNLSFTDGSFACTANEFGTIDVSAQSDDVLITGVEGNL